MAREKVGCLYEKLRSNKLDYVNLIPWLCFYRETNYLVLMETRFCSHITNLDLNRNFYEKILKWPIYKEWNRSETDRGVVYQAGPLLLEFLLSPHEAATKFDDSFYLYMEVPDPAVTRALFTDHLWPATEIRTYPWGHSSFTVKDPSGLSLKFFTQ